MTNLLRSIFLLCLVLGSAWARTVATFHTPLGDMDVELYDDQKPVTVQNFIKLVQNGAYQNSFFHRCESGSVLQGGGYSTASPTSLDLFNQALYVPNYGKITNEFLVGQKIGNTYGTIAMAKVDGDPNSATSQFFFNLKNNSAVFDSANGGYTVFGRVISGASVLEQFGSLQSNGGGIVDMRNYIPSWSVFYALPVNYQGFGWPRYYDLMYTDIKLSNYAPYYTLTLATNGNGSVFASPSQPAYPAGTAVQLSATASEGYSFASWSGSYSGTQNPLAVIVSSNLSITAKFDRTWSLTVTNTPGGSVTKVPDLPAYVNQSTVTLLPVAYGGFRFVGWSGAAAGTANPLSVVMNTNLTIGAMFLDIAPPQITIQSPVSGNSADERMSLAGIVTDNVRLESVRWELDGQPMGLIAVNTNNNTFSVGRIALHRGANVVRVVAEDAAGNQGASDVVVTWTPSRTVLAGAVADQQEGSLVTVPLQLSSKGDVGGLNFMLNYDTNYLADAKFAWGLIAANSQKQVQPGVGGRIQANFQLPGAVIPAGTMTFASVSFRLRSVPSAVSTPLTLSVSRVSMASGEQIAFGTDVQNGSVGILKRTLTGDGNANNKLDIGDAVLIQRLVGGFTPQRAWDATGNDLNKNGLLDAEDVTRVLRIVAGPDSQPSGAAGLFPSDMADNLAMDAGAVLSTVVAAISDQMVASPPAGQVLEGQKIALQVLFTNLIGQISGAALEINYPTNAFRLVAYQTNSPMVSGGSAVLWNSVEDGLGASAGKLALAAASPTAWPGTNGLVATIILQAAAGSASATPWTVTVDRIQATPDGYDLRTMAGVSIPIHIGAAGGPRLESIVSPAGGASFGFVITGQSGQSWQVEASQNLTDWAPLLQTNSATGSVKFTDSKSGQYPSRFYRVVVP